jgi:hypothetical protein
MLTHLKKNFTQPIILTKRLIPICKQIIKTIFRLLKTDRICAAINKVFLPNVITFN